MTSPPLSLSFDPAAAVNPSFERGNRWPTQLSDCFAHKLAYQTMLAQGDQLVYGGTNLDMASGEGQPGIMAEIWIPAGAKHCLTSLGSEVRVPESAFGNWQQEHILRFADDYDRSSQGGQGAWNHSAKRPRT